MEVHVTSLRIPRCECGAPVSESGFTWGDYISWRERAKSAESELTRLRDGLRDWLAAYDAASMADEEGLMWTVDPKAMRELWQACDDAAESARSILSAQPNQQEQA